MATITMARIRKMRNNEMSAATSDAARLANELQRAHSGMTRTEALREAERLQYKHGLGLVLAPAPKRCEACRSTGLIHCSDPANCGGPWSDPAGSKA